MVVRPTPVRPPPQALGKERSQGSQPKSPSPNTTGRGDMPITSLPSGRGRTASLTTVTTTRTLTSSPWWSPR